MATTASANMLLSVFMFPLAAALSPVVATAFSSAERLSFQLDREREGLLRRLRQRANGGDSLTTLMPSSYALAEGCCIAVTGAASGIGREAAAFLAQRGFPVVLCSRSHAKVQKAVQYIAGLPGVQSEKLASVTFDQCSVFQTARGANDIMTAADKMGAPLRGLLLNAGVWPTERRITTDGMEEGFQVCHLSHQLLTMRLLPQLCAPGEEARVVTVASSAHAFPDTLDLSDRAWTSRRWDATAAYGESKLANVLFAQELAQRLPLTADQRLTSLCVHPGVVATSLFREFGAAADLPIADALTAGSSPLSLFLKSPSDGCRTSVRRNAL